MRRVPHAALQPHYGGLWGSISTHFMGTLTMGSAAELAPLQAS